MIFSFFPSSFSFARPPPPLLFPKSFPYFHLRLFLGFLIIVCVCVCGDGDSQINLVMFCGVTWSDPYRRRTFSQTYRCLPPCAQEIQPRVQPSLSHQPSPHSWFWFWSWFWRQHYFNVCLWCRCYRRRHCNDDYDGRYQCSR